MITSPDTDISPRGHVATLHRALSSGLPSHSLSLPPSHSLLLNFIPPATSKLELHACLPNMRLNNIGVCLSFPSSKCAFNEGEYTRIPQYTDLMRNYSRGKYLEITISGSHIIVSLMEYLICIYIIGSFK